MIDCSGRGSELERRTSAPSFGRYGKWGGSVEIGKYWFRYVLRVTHVTLRTGCFWLIPDKSQ